MSEKRGAHRQRSLKGGKIVFNNRHSVIDCTIRNLSATGACLEMMTFAGIPDDFDLVFDSDQSSRPVHVIWHKNKRLGINFV